MITDFFYIDEGHKESNSDNHSSENTPQKKVHESKSKKQTGFFWRLFKGK